MAAHRNGGHERGRGAPAHLGLWGEPGGHHCVRCIAPAHSKPRHLQSWEGERPWVRSTPSHAASLPVGPKFKCWVCTFLPGSAYGVLLSRIPDPTSSVLGPQHVVCSVDG